MFQKFPRELLLYGLNYSPPPLNPVTLRPVWSDMTLLIILQASFLFIHCPANKKITLYYYTLSPLQDSAQGLHFLPVLSCNLSKDSGGFCGEMNSSLYYRYSRRINPLLFFIIIRLSVHHIVLSYVLFYWVKFNTLRTGNLNCLNARSRGLTFRQRASCM